MLKTTAALRDDFQINEDVIIVADAQTGLPAYQWIEAAIRNKVLVFYDFNVPGIAPNEYGTRRLYTAQQSVDDFGPEAIIEMTFRGVRASLGGQTLADQVVTAYLQYWGAPAHLLRVPVCYLKHPLEILDEVRVTHPLIKNRITGRLGLDRERFVVVDITPQFMTQGRFDLVLLWVQAIETSAAPTGVGAGLGQPSTTFDGTDVSVPFGGTAQVTTAANTKSLRLGLKATKYRWWTHAHLPTDQEQGCAVCPGFGSGVFNDWVFNSLENYTIEYKTSAAPNTPGSGGDPTTGWIVLTTEDRGNTNLFASTTCHLSPSNPGTPSEDQWSKAYLTLGASPNTYNVRVTFNSAMQVGDPGMGIDCFNNGPPPTWVCAGTPCASIDNGGSIQADVRTLTIDFIESQS